MKTMAAICFVLTTFFAVPSRDEEPVNVTLVQLITTPEKFDGKLIRVIGFCDLPFALPIFSAAPRGSDSCLKA